LKDTKDEDIWGVVCSNFTPLVQLHPNSFNARVEIGEENVIHEFTTFWSSFTTLFWCILDPGHPEVVGCSGGISRFVALGLYGLYNIIIAIVLLNLLIALMGVTMTRIEDDKVPRSRF
jgi:hypothetical protein